MKVFLDGQYGTTGLQLRDRLLNRSDIELLSIPEELRKNPEARSKAMNESDLVFLCLPDQAAREAVSFVTNPRVRIIDSSSAFRTADGWTYGLPELSGSQREAIKNASRVTVPGCHATAFVLALRPLVASGLLPPDYPISYQSLTGYSGGGNALIERYRSGAPDGAGQGSFEHPQHYSLGLHHKHLPEMKKWTGLAFEPAFLPTVCKYYNGLVGTVSLAVRMLGQRLIGQRIRLQDIQTVLAEFYLEDPFVKVLPLADATNASPYELDPTRCNGTNLAEIAVYGNDEFVLLACRLDNLGKGSSGAAVQCMNLMFGLDETSGLIS